jgi:hypothetical protein
MIHLDITTTIHLDITTTIHLDITTTIHLDITTTIHLDITTMIHLDITTTIHLDITTMIHLDILKKENICHKKVFLPILSTNFQIVQSKLDLMAVHVNISMECLVISIFMRPNTKPNGNTKNGMDLVYH